MSYTKQNFKTGDILYASQLNAMDNEIATLESEVNSTKNMVGHPYTVATASAMSDQTKIYVYTGSESGYSSGHWYYHNGTAWTDGGVYNSVAVNTDSTLTVSGQAADSKAVGDAIGDVETEISDVKGSLNQLENAVEELEMISGSGGSGLPEVDSSDDGKVPQVIDGEWVMSLGVQDQLDQISVLLGSVESLTWAQRMRYVRSGLGRTMFPVGTQFNSVHGILGNIVWDVADHDHFANPYSPSAHTMTLVSHYIYKNDHIAWSTGTAMLYAPEGLPAGSYSFVIKNRTTLTQDNNSRIYFTIQNAIPARGQIRPLTVVYNASYIGKTAGIFEDCYATEPIETFTFTNKMIAGATDLGDAGSGYLNDSGCVDNGNTDYDVSELRQWLNSDMGIGEWWQPENRFSRVDYDHTGVTNNTIKNYMLTLPGFMHDLDEDFMNYVIRVDYPCCSGGYSVNHDPLTPYTVRDYFTLPTSVEVGAKASKDELTIGQCLELFANSDNTKRIKYIGPNSGSGLRWNLRDPKKMASTSNALRSITSKGTVDGVAAVNGINLVMMCTLA